MPGHTYWKGNWPWCKGPSWQTTDLVVVRISPEKRSHISVVGHVTKTHQCLVLVSEF